MRFAWLFILCVLLIPVSGHAQQLAEPGVQSLITSMESAATRRDAEGVARHLSESATIVMNLRLNGQTQRMTLNKAQYLESLRQVWGHAGAYRYDRSNTRIAFPAPNKAVVTATVSESISVQGHAARSVSDETVVIELVGGQPKITSIAANVRM